MASTDYVEVYDEPFHRRRFENEFVRVYDVLIPPGGLTLYHRHCEDTIYVSVADAHQVREQTWGETPQKPTPYIPAGIGICRGHRDEPLIHQVHNGGDAPMRMIGAELKGAPPSSGSKPISAPGVSLISDEPRYRAYMIELTPGAETGALDWNFAALTFSLAQASIEVKADEQVRAVTAEPGMVDWLAGPLTVNIRNIGESPYKAILLELCR